jgi:murein DD-endopeptidase MepM/ murein hydrolase activator NlpD
MSRAALLLPLLLALPAGAAPTPKVMTAPTEGGHHADDGVLLVARIARWLDAELPRSWTERLVRIDLEVRDAVHHVFHQLTELAATMPVPDLTVLAVDPVANTESSGYGWRDDPFGHDRRFHHGTDFHAKPGTPVLAAGDGMVVFAGRQGGYGNVVYVDHGGGIVTRYGHLSKIETTKDATITAGQTIGLVGSTGRATGPHLHFEVRIDGRDVSPITAMSVAETQREDPEAGRLAAFALRPEIQQASRDHSDDHVAGKPAPKHPVRSKRAQILW